MRNQNGPRPGIGQIRMVGLALLILLAACSRDAEEGWTTPGGDPPTAPSRPLDIHARFDRLLLGRLEGVMVQATELGGLHPVFANDIRSRWTMSWVVAHTAAVAHNGEGWAVENRKYESVRSVELIAPTSSSEKGLPLDSDFGTSVVSLSDDLRSRRSDLPPNEASWFLLRSDAFNFGDVALLTGMEQDRWASEPVSVDACARILDVLEGHEVILGVTHGSIEWSTLDHLQPSRKPGEIMRSDRPIDYSMLYPPSAVGSRTRFAFEANELLPPALLDEVFGDFDASVRMESTHLENRVVAGVTNEVHAGHGRLHIVQDERVSLSINLTHAEVWIETPVATDRLLSRIHLVADVPRAYVTQHPRFGDVTWEGDLRLEVLYEVMRRE